MFLHCILPKHVLLSDLSSVPFRRRRGDERSLRFVDSAAGSKKIKFTDNVIIR